MANMTDDLPRWSLEALLPATAGPEFEAIPAALERAVGELETWRERLSPDLSEVDFVDLLSLVETISALARRLGSYGYLWYAEDTQNQDALSFRGRMEKLLAEVRNRTLFFDLWWKDLDDDAAGRLATVSGEARYYLDSLRRFKPHTLTEPEEKIINLKDINGVQALVTVYEMITNDFGFKIEIDGEVRELTRAELGIYVRDPRPEVRAAAYQELFRVFSEQAIILGQIYQHVARDWASENLTLRGFSEPITARNLRNDIPDPVADTLLEVCRRNAPLYQRYFTLKAQWLGLDSLHRYDIYAPLGESDRVYDFEEAADLVLQSLRDFEPVLADYAARVVGDGHLDAQVRPRKDSGAFCASVLPGVTPWVLVNYNGRSDDVATLAHEIGHAIHGLAAAHHSVLTFHSSLPMAETASVFSEMLLLDRLLADEPNPVERRQMLARFVDNSYATVMRQAFFVLFEREAHALIEQGRTADHLAERYMANLREQFGDALELSDEFRWEWVTIPHIYHTPFYCYAYSFGQLLVLALYRQYQLEGREFVPKYLRILSYGGSASPNEILSQAGIDMTSAEFWQGGFDIIAEIIQELQSLS